MWCRLCSFLVSLASSLWSLCLSTATDQGKLLQEKSEEIREIVRQTSETLHELENVKGETFLPAEISLLGAILLLLRLECRPGYQGFDAYLSIMTKCHACHSFASQRILECHTFSVLLRDTPLPWLTQYSIVVIHLFRICSFYFIFYIYFIFFFSFCCVGGGVTLDLKRDHHHHHHL